MFLQGLRFCLTGRAVFVVLSITLIVGCGGSGGGSAETSRPPSGYLADHSVSSTYELTRANVPVVAETLRFETMGAIFIFDELRKLYPQPMPTFQLKNARRKVACDHSGYVMVTIKDRGATIAQDYENCKDSEDGMLISGTLRSYIHDVDNAAKTYKATIEYVDYSGSQDGERTTRSTIQVFSVSVDENNILLVETESHGTTFDSGVGEEYESNLRFTSIYYRLPDAFFGVPEINGYMDYQSSGAVLLSSQTDGVLTTIAGFGDERAAFKLFLNHYGIGFTTADGEQFSAGVAMDKVSEVDAFSASNSAPEAKSWVNNKVFYADENAPIVLALDNAFYDPDLDLLKVDVTVQCQPENADVSVDLQEPFKMTVTTDTFGSYTLYVVVTDAQGRSAHASFPFQYWAEEGAENNEPRVCSTLPPSLPIGIFAE